MKSGNIRIEGGLLSPDFFENIYDFPGQKDSDFSLEKNTTIFDEATNIYSDARVYWEAFQKRLQRLKNESVTSVTREMWVIPLLEAMNYKLNYQHRAPQADGKTYAISHKAGDDHKAPPVHIVACDQELGSRPPSGRGTMAPHALLQDYLNRTEHLWGIVTNGKLLRLLRNSAYFTRPSYIEFDLEEIIENDQLSEFILFFRLVHRTRLPHSIDDGPECYLEQYYQQAIDQGNRIRDGLRDAVEEAILTLGNGFLNHPMNGQLREKMSKRNLTGGEFYRQLLYLIYRFLFLMVAEERHLINPQGVSRKQIKYYREFFSLERIRTLSEFPGSNTKRYYDLYLGLQVVFQALRDNDLAQKIGLLALNGELFQPLTDLDEAIISNEDLLKAINCLSFFRSPDGIKRRVNYGALDVEELGSVYESLLEYKPGIESKEGKYSFVFTSGMERKTTGSYYTPQELVNELIKTALVPVIEDRLKEAGRDEQLKEEAILSITVCDPACGSGHFLLAAARRLGRELAQIRTGDDEPSPEQIREAVRDVISRCIYGVDKNPLAVDLCKVALWIEGHSRSKPLTFLDHKIKCGDSLIGVLNLDVLEEGIPNEAYNPLKGDDKSVAQSIKREKNTPELKKGLRSIFSSPKGELKNLIDEKRELLEKPDDNPQIIREKDSLYKTLNSEGSSKWKHRTACDLWTAAFFSIITKENYNEGLIPTTGTVKEYLNDQAGNKEEVIRLAKKKSQKHKFFHWPVEFPEVFNLGGFDVVLCNPPWERIKLQEKEFFSGYDEEIANASNASERKGLIKKLPETNPELWEKYLEALFSAEAEGKFLRNSGRFPLTAKGDINTYSVFSEHFKSIIQPQGYSGSIVPTGIATDNNNKEFFSNLIEKGRLSSLYDFENRKKLFPVVDSRFKFCLLTVKGKEIKKTVPPKFAFYLSHIKDLRDDERVFTLTLEDFENINPNTKTCPVFRTKTDAELVKKIYEKVPVLINENTGENPWGISFNAMFHMSNDSHLFKTRQKLEEEGFELKGNKFFKRDEVWLPLYEAKMIWLYDHRFGSYKGIDSRTSTHIKHPSENEYKDPFYVGLPWYWVSLETIKTKIKNFDENWFFGFRDVSNSTNERTGVFSIIPFGGAGNNLPLIFSSEPKNPSLLIGNLSSLTFDFFVRLKVAGTHLNFFYVKQFPVLSPCTYTREDENFITPRIIELIFSSWDIKPFVDEVWGIVDNELREKIKARWKENQKELGQTRRETPEELSEGSKKGFPYFPFKWDRNRRQKVKAELDAYYAKLYGFTRKELLYILDPEGVKGKEFPGETFRVLKEKEQKNFGEYRTKRLVLESWDRMK